MDRYTCSRCNYTTNSVSNYKKHLLRKNSCETLFESISTNDLLQQLDLKQKRNFDYKCEYCEKTFKTPQNKYQHKQRCAKNVNISEHVEEKLNALEEEIRNLKSQISTPPTIAGTSAINTNKNNQNSNNNNNNSNNVVNQVVINVKSFGQENLSYIEKDKDFLTSCLMSRDIKSLIENIHCDKNHPENHNVRIKSTKQELMETFVDGGWIISDQEETLDELMNKGYRVLKFHSHRNKNDIKAECEDDEDEYDNLMNWLENVYDDKKVRKPIKRQLLILFMNKRTMLLEKEIE
jgi:hypothetical protein